MCAAGLGVLKFASSSIYAAKLAQVAVAAACISTADACNRGQATDRSSSNCLHRNSVNNECACSNGIAQKRSLLFLYKLLLLLATQIIGGTYMMNDRAGDHKITATTGRVAPDRRWFGNTRVIGQVACAKYHTIYNSHLASAACCELDKFREEMTTRAADPYSVVLRRSKLPMGLLQESAKLRCHRNKQQLERGSNGYCDVPVITA
eukprot:12202-Heterococcus_DN1.PRE.1